MAVIRVAQILGHANAGGVESIIMNLYKNIDREQVQFDFFVENTCPIIDREVIEKLGGRVVFIPKYTHIFKYMRTLKKLFKEGNYDIVHSNLNALSVFSLWAAKKAGIKIRIAHSHSTSNKKEWKKNIIKNMLRPFSRVFPTHLFACSELSAKWLFGKKAWDSGRVMIVNNAVDLEKFKINNEIRTSIRKDYDIEDKLVIGNIGRFMAQKNHEFLIDIFNEVVKIHSDTKLLLIGDGPLEEKIVEKVKKLKLNDKVLFLGLQKCPEKFYQAMDAFLLPSLYEGLPVVGIEAQVNGLNCYFSDTVTREVKVNENVKFLPLNKNPELWAKSIVDDSKNPINREIGYQNMCHTNYNIVNEAEKLLAKYKKLVKAK